MRKWQFLVDRTDIDDFPRPIRLTKMTHDGLRYEKHALQVDVENGVEIGFRHIPEVRPFLQTRVIDQDIDLAEAGDSLLDESLAVGNLSDIRLKSGGAALGRRCDSL